MTSTDSLWIPFAAFGADPCALPRRVGIRVATGETLDHLAGGAVIYPRSFEWNDDDILEPVPYGLYAEDTFGLLPRTARGDVDLAAYEHPTFSKRPQIVRAGRIDLADAVLHPWVARFMPERIDAATGVERAVWSDLLAGRRVVDAKGEVFDVESAGDREPAGWRFGRDAIYALARRAKRGHEIPGLRVLPVLAAGLRHAIVKNDRVMVRDASLLYANVIRANDAARDAVRTSTRVGDRAAAQAKLQRAIDALMLEGLDADGANATSLATAKLQPLGGSLTERFGGRSVAELANATDGASLVKILRGPLFIFRALVEASALEIVPLLEDGAVDEVARARSIRDRFAGTLQAVYDEQLGKSWGGMVMHGHDDDPHVDVHPFLPRERGSAILVTAGMSAQPMIEAFERADPFVELVCFVPPDLDDTTRDDLMRSLLLLARYPFVRKTFFAAGHDVSAGAPLARGSRLSGWAFDELDEEWTERLSMALPRYPIYLRAVGLTAEELEFKRANGAAALRERMKNEGTWERTDPRR